MLAERERTKKSGVAVVNGVTYAVGLMWEPADNPDKALKEAYSVAKSEGVNADFLCLRLSTPPQYGLGWKSVDHANGNKPLAVAVTENVGGNYIGAFKIDDRWWFGMSKNDIILPYGDAFYYSEDEVKEAMKNILSEISGGDIIKFAPASWGIEGSRDSGLETLITNVPKVKLSPTDSMMSRYKNAMLSVIILLFLGYMLTNYISEKIEKRNRIKEQRIKDIEEAMKKINPWKEFPSVEAFFAECLNGISALPLGMSGWSVEQATCSENGIKASMTNQGGFVYDIENKAKQSEFSLSLNPAGNAAILSKSFSKLQPRRSYVNGSELWSGNEISQQLLDLKSKVGVDVKISGVSNQPAQKRVMVDGDGNEVTLDPVYKAIDFSFETDYPAKVWTGYISAFPASSLKNITLNLDSSVSWKISGTIYQK